MEEIFPYRLRSFASQIFEDLGRANPIGVYRRALAMVLHENGISFSEQSVVSIVYKSQVIDESQRCDFLLPEENAIICIQQSANEPYSADLQVVKNKARALNVKHAYLINFGLPCIMQRESVDFFHMILP
jgi:GxxExxY protein